MSEEMDLSRFTGRAESENVSRQRDPRREMSSPAEKEKPDFYRRGLEREGGSEWSGKTMGGGTWAGRSR